MSEFGHQITKKCEVFLEMFLVTFSLFREGLFKHPPGPLHKGELGRAETELIVLCITFAPLFEI